MEKPLHKGNAREKPCREAMCDDLVKRLRDLGDHAAFEPHMHHTAADRIEELEATNARLETEAKIQAEEIDKTRRRADKWQSMVLDCEEYLKFGETPAERIEREINDCLALMKFLETKQVRIEELEAKLAKAVEELQEIASLGRCDFAKIRTTLAELKGGKDG